MKPKTKTHKFILALQGIITAIKTQPHFKFHLMITPVVVIMGFACQISQIEWVMLTLTIFGVYITEMINTSIETTINLVTTDSHPLAKLGKDIAAGAVLLSAIMSLIIGYLIFKPRLVTLCEKGWYLFG